MAGRKRTARDDRRRSYGQNFLVRSSVVRQFLEHAEFRPGEHVVDFGAGKGALTLPLARAGAIVTAIERDPVWAQRLEDRLQQEGLSGRVAVLCRDLRRYRLPDPPFRVASNPPFGLTTDLLARLLDNPEQGPERADLLIQREVARKWAAVPPSTLRSAAWSPCWLFEAGPMVPRQAFRPTPRVDAGWLVIRKREPPVLPPWLAANFVDTLRDVWRPPPR